MFFASLGGEAYPPLLRDAGLEPVRDEVVAQHEPGHGDISRSAGAGPSGRAVEIRKVGVVGLGTMGAGIAQISVQAGFETVGREVTAELGERGRATIDALPRPRRREGPDVARRIATPRSAV